ncbi:MAG: hypothetical protein IT336_14275 [Thermomicrobiales bacterium]|nr:hypothetical protein [Thermomicrobiales bacterium]
MESNERRVLLAKGHGIYWLVSGIWPVVHMPSFEAVTGPKVDRWLVKTVGALIAVAGAGLVQSAANKRVTPELETVAIGTALSLTAVDLVYVAKRRISPIYLLDAVVHTALAIAWRTFGAAKPTATKLT